MCVVTFCRIFKCGHLEAVLKVDERCEKARENGVHYCTWMCEPPVLKGESVVPAQDCIMCSLISRLQQREGGTTNNPQVASLDVVPTPPQAYFPLRADSALTRDTFPPVPLDLESPLMVLLNCFRLTEPVMDSMNYSHVRNAIHEPWVRPILLAKHRTLLRRHQTVATWFPRLANLNPSDAIGRDFQSWILSRSRERPIDMEIVRIFPCSRPEHSNEGLESSDEHGNEGLDSSDSTGYDDESDDEGDEGDDGNDGQDRGEDGANVGEVPRHRFAPEVTLPDLSLYPDTSDMAEELLD